MLPVLSNGGLYAITDSRHSGAHLIQQVEQAIQGGACLVQYRAKQGSFAERRATATGLLACCRTYQVPLLINDDVALAVAIGADGVHLGRDDMPLVAARQQLGPNAIIGVSCYNQWALAKRYADHADYLAFGRFFSSKTKPQAAMATPELLRHAQSLACPIVAIGGINIHNGHALIQAGADFLAVVDGLFNTPNIRHTAQQFSQLMTI